VKNLVALLFVLSFLFQGTLAEARGGKLMGGIRSLTVGQFAACAIDDDGIKCWGDDFYPGAPDQPVLADALGVAVSMEVNWVFACAFSKDQAKCWGNNTYGQLNLPPLRNPKSIVAGAKHACALDDDGVHCWGDNALHQREVPPLLHPRSLSAGLYFTCALDDTGIHCWGDDAYTQCEVPALNKPVSVSAGGFHACALDADGLKCWGLSFHGELNVPHFKNLKSYSASWGHTCAVDEDAVICWGSKLSPESPPTYTISSVKPKLVRASTYRDFVIDEKGLIGFRGRTPKPRVNDVTVQLVSAENPAFSLVSPEDPAFSLNEITDFLSVASGFSPPAQSAVLSKWKEFSYADVLYEDASTEASLARYLMAKLLAPLIESNDSQYSREKLIPSFELSMSGFEKELGFSDISHIPRDVELNRKVALQAIEVSLKILDSFLSLEDRTAMQVTGRDLGKATLTPMDEDKIHTMLQDLSGDEGILAKVSRNPKSAFLVESVKMAAAWLKGSL